MPLRLKCPTCRQTLTLDDVFQGAHCRCAHCRTLMAVPAVSRARMPRPAERPEAPPMAAAGSKARPKPIPRPATPAQASFFRRTSFRILAASLVLGAGVTGVAVWKWSDPARPGEVATVRTDPAPGLVPVEANASPLDARPNEMLAADPLHTYFGVPISGATVGYVLDCDASMAPYLDDVAFMTQIMNRTMSAEGKRFGVVQALARSDGTQSLEISEPSTDLVGAWTTMQGSLPGGDTNLPAALAVAQNWYADQVFLVLAKPLEERDIALLQQHAMQTRAVTHVVALGQAASLDFSAIAGPTGGRFIPVDDQVFHALVNNYKIAIDAERQGG